MSQIFSGDIYFPEGLLTGYQTEYWGRQKLEQKYHLISSQSPQMLPSDLSICGMREGLMQWYLHEIPLSYS